MSLPYNLLPDNVSMSIAFDQPCYSGMQAAVQTNFTRQACSRGRPYDMAIAESAMQTVLLIAIEGKGNGHLSDPAP